MILFLSLFCVAFISCIETTAPSNPEDESPRQGTALFIVNEVTGNLHISERDVLPTKFILKLRACIHSRLRNEPLPFTDYAITHNKSNLNNWHKSKKKATDIPVSSHLKAQTGREMIRLKTDGDSCLNWTEEYSYAYNLISEWIVIDRYIEGLSTNWPGATGALPVAINPWLQLKEYKHLQVVDYRDKYEHKKDSILKDRVSLNGIEFLKQAKQREQTEKVDIIVNDIIFFTDQSDIKNHTEYITAHIKGSMNYTIQDIFGKLHHDNIINSGEFMINPTPIRHYTKTINPPLPQKPQTEEEILNTLIKNSQKNTPETINRAENINRNKDIKAMISFQNNKLISNNFILEVSGEPLDSPISIFVVFTPLNNTLKRVQSFTGEYYFGELFRDILDAKNIPLDNILMNRYEQKVLEKINRYKTQKNQQFNL